MKHGDKAQKSAKAVQASGKKGSSQEAVAKTREASGSSKVKTSSKEAGEKAGGKKAGGEAAAKTATKAPTKAPAKAATKAGSESKASGSNGKTKAVGGDNGTFANAIVGAAF